MNGLFTSKTPSMAAAGLDLGRLWSVPIAGKR
jgi:hypothetical protein